LLTGADTLHNYPSENLPFTLVNNYGPTECTVVATSGAVLPRQTKSKAEDRLPSIGRAIDNAEIYILDRTMSRVSPGEIGEIYIGGALLAKGYLNDPALTAERFVNNPYAPGSKLYRTGDLGCQLSDGQIAFHGRADEQVKINGYRIELNEVAGVLRRHPAIRESVVALGETDSGGKQMIAYIVPRSVSPTVAELRDFLADELPEYMLPAVFVSLNSLPTKSSGKVDRSALPAPNEQNVLRDEAFLGPRTPTEQRVASIVARLLGLQQVGMNDNFFYLGGNSLFGTQVIARLRDAFGVEVPLLKLFDHPTVADLSAEVERMIMAKVDSISEEEAQRLLSLHTEQANA
jgi:acyl carrier protein